jgi:hypothetical protein
MSLESFQHWLPTQPYNAKGQVRTVGIELEFSSITHAQTSEAVARWAGQPVHYDSLVQAVVKHPDLGKFEIEVDWRYLKETAHEQQITEGSDNWVKLLREVARLMVPVEVVAPPIPMTQLPQLEGLIDQLRLAGAQGTGDSPIAAYGLHLNPEVPDMTAEAILPYLKAFALLQWWLEEKHHVDVTRRLSPYVHLYPDAFLYLVLRYPQTPSMDQLLDDYFEHNPTRNRALDMWPIFAEYAPEKVEALMHEPLIKARPTFHYRLPNCEIDRPSWHLWNEWSAWLVLERLANEPSSLERLTNKFFSGKRPFLGVNKRLWIKTIDEWLNDRS